MSICVFVGPTLRVEDARHVLDAEYLPPAAVGDVYRAARRRPYAIAIIDGFFERTPAIWHKEVLWAMAEGVHVFGSSSMGALRAAELAAFGMQGVGKVFEAYHAGEIIDDDEVAVAHAGREDGYLSFSDAMVNIRLTLAAAQEQRILSADSRRELERLAKSLFYPERKLELVSREARARDLLSQSEAKAFEAWLPRGRVDQKRADALELLRLLRDSGAMLREKKRVSYEFEHTHTWEQLLQEVGACDASIEGAELDEAEFGILEQLKLNGQFLAARRAGMGRVLALEEVARIGRRVTPNELRSTSKRLRQERRLLKPEEFRAWLVENSLDGSSLEDFLSDEASVSWLDLGLAQVSELHILDHLRISGEYARLHAYVARRDAALLESGHDTDAPELPDGIAVVELWRWYFEDRLASSVPANLPAYAQGLGFEDQAAFQTAVLKEFLSRDES